MIFIVHGQCAKRSFLKILNLRSLVKTDISPCIYEWCVLHAPEMLAWAKFLYHLNKFMLRSTKLRFVI